MRIADFPDCHRPLVQILPIEPASASLLDYMAAFGPVMALLAVIVTIVIYQSDHKRALRTERDQLLKLIVTQLEGEAGTAQGAAKIDLQSGNDAQRFDSFLALLNSYRGAAPSGYLEASLFKLGLLDIETISELMRIRASKSAIDRRIDRVLDNFNQDREAAYKNVRISDPEFKVPTEFQKTLGELAAEQTLLIERLHGLIEEHNSRWFEGKFRMWSRTR